MGNQITHAPFINIELKSLMGDVINELNGLAPSLSMIINNYPTR